MLFSIAKVIDVDDRSNFKPLNYGRILNLVIDFLSE